MERKLAAILAADIAGYSRLMGADEEATLNTLRSHREVVDGLVAVHRGRIFHSAGDSVVAEFPSAVEASLCAVEIQQEIARRNEPVPKDKRLEFRIGVNIGDVVVEGGNLFGDGVNVADRVQKLAEPGGICVSRNVHDQLRNKVGFVLEPMGEHQVKNIALPVSVYRVLVDGAARRPRVTRWLAMVARQHRRRMAVAAAVLVIVAAGMAALWPSTPPPRTGFPSVAVLPFQNFSGDPALDPYGDGVAEDLITIMSRFPDLTLVSRNSSFRYKGKEVNPTEVGRDLRVDYVIEGSVQKKGDGLRINAQLIDPQTNAHVWAEGYDGSDPSAFQDEAVGKIVVALAGLSGQIAKNEYQRIKGKAKADFDEYDYYLSGKEIFSRFESIEEHDRAGAIWREGIEKFPDSALLRIELAWYHFFRPWDFDTDKPFADYRRAGELAREVLAGQNLSPSVRWRGHGLMAYINWFDGDFIKAVAAAEAAVAVAPYDAGTLSLMSRVQIASGNPSRGLEWVQESIRRDPTIPRNTRILAWIYYLTGNYEKSIEAAKRHNELSREFAADANAYMVASYVRLGRLEEARAAMKQALEAEPEWNQLRERDHSLEQPYKDRSIAERELADLARAGLPELPFGYDSKVKDRLTAEEIKALTFGHTRRGRDVKSGAAFSDVIAKDGALSTSGDLGPGTATLLYLGGKLICYGWTDWGPSCSAVFRNPDGTADHQDEYILVEACCEYRFSVVK
jgi:class 3 adenylate cyclase/TolB-like protein/tetratricopeptide (TPR) repeat protein